MKEKHTFLSVWNSNSFQIIKCSHLFWHHDKELIKFNCTVPIFIYFIDHILKLSFGRVLSQGPHNRCQFLEKVLKIKTWGRKKATIILHLLASYTRLLERKNPIIFLLLLLTLCWNEKTEIFLIELVSPTWYVLHMLQSLRKVVISWMMFTFNISKFNWINHLNINEWLQ